MFDLLIEGGRVIDGAGSPWCWADVAVENDRIAAVGRLAGAAANVRIKAEGRVVSPGFIDMHTHSDLHLLVDPIHECKLRQGVTTDVIGHDGLGLAPVTPETADILREQLSAWNGLPDIDRDWTTLTDYLDRFDGRATVNVAALASHGTARMAVLGMENRQPTPAELTRLKAIIDQCMREGAIGLSTGLTCAPCMFADDDELVALCETIRPYQGFYCPHHRSYGVEALKGYQDSLEIGRRANVPVRLTHCHLSFPINEGRIGSLDRGLIRPGFKADLTVFDPDSLRATSTYENPRDYAEGVGEVIVNGTRALADSQPTGATPMADRTSASTASSRTERIAA